MKYKKGSLAVGFPTIVNILLLLIFSCVSMLSLSHARADEMTAKHSIEISNAYFNADNQGQKILGLLSRYSSLSPDDAGHEMENLLNEQGVAAVYDKDNQVLNITIPANNAGTLSIAINLTGIGEYKILKWQLIAPESNEIN